MEQELYLLLHSVVMHAAAAVVVLLYIPLCVPARLFRWAFVSRKKEDLGGKVVLITGASSGIGEELAYQYARRGACLALVARRKQALESVAAAARERGAPDVLVLPADVADPDQSRGAVEETVAHFGERTCVLPE
jgi:NADPH:quinone reductase-like Zn-dependent oxidoreductase